MSIALVQGANRGLGLAFVRALKARGDTVVGTCRRPEEAGELAATGAEVLRLDVTDEASIAAAAAEVRAHHGRLDLLLNVAGILHRGSDIQPEKKLDEVHPAALEEVFRINAFGPLLVAKHFRDLLTSHRERAVLANLSARVGSIGDNRLGGWYAYRASKSAQNMFTRGLSIELGRRSEALIVMALHPGTVDTGLSKPFQRSVKPGKLFEVDRAAAQLLAVVDGATRETHHGGFFAWDGAPIPW
jgi:NAD(P)-dependent dehydrogenase (short-subunit alcohol dehydrogenase family)